MDVEFLTEDLSAEDSFEVDDNNFDYSTLDGERCGICMDIIIDRGVLDCCQHWFCFTCIDNWATITNLCPLCQNEFQLITCVPVYDTTGSNKIEDDSLSRDDDWCIEGKSNTLSFPSYYIDENAVICLDGDGCKIRSGSVKVEEDLNLDTSIACDSCDLWYHAFCVGFDPDGTCENSWLCPRCLADEHPQKSEVLPTVGPGNHCGTQNSNSERFVDASYSGKVSVSLADAGETAVVVSMVERKQGTEGSNEEFLTVEMSENLKLGTCNSKLETPTNKMAHIQMNMETHELELSLSQDSSSKLPSTSLDLNELKKSTEEPSGFDGDGVSSTKLLNEPCESSVNLQLGSFLSVDNIKNNVAEDQVAGDMQQNSISEECLLPADKTLPKTKGTVVGITGAKRKHRDYSNDVQKAAEDEETKARVKTKPLAKRIRAERDSKATYLLGQANESVSKVSRKHLGPTIASGDDELGSKSEEKIIPSDIMSIVQGTDRRTLTKERENTSGLRVKKILRRAAEDKESSVLVQKLRKEIREEVRNKTSKEFGKNLFDPKLLAAFRVAVAGPETEPAKKLPPLVVKTKKSMLEKGKIRENLTRKIYAIGGRRRKAWTRDCEVEFWKHRCLKTTKPEKVDTLKSVLDLLRKSPEDTEMKPRREGEATNSILSRLYLADSSVMPRKDNVKPILATKASGNPEENKEHALPENACASTPQTNEDLSQFCYPSPIGKGTKNAGFTSIKTGAVSTMGHPNKYPERLSVASLGGSKGNSQKDLKGKSVNVKTDKRKWALEVLARKTAVKGGNGVQEKQEDIAVRKGNFPLLVQLPTDMRPVLAPCRHNKIPISVRQAQLYRLTEHFLRKANLPVIRRTADMELAIADAVNIELAIANKSNSKLVYVNLCSQELRNRSDNVKTQSAIESNASPSSEVTTEQSSDDSCNGSVVEEALRNAGLLSDSPPNSPNHKIEVNNDEDDPSKKSVEEGPDNIFEMDSHPELDIYGDFEYDLEDEDYIGASALKLSNQQPEEETQIKVLFSTLNSDVSNNAPDNEDHSRSLALESGSERCVAQDPLLGEGSEEPSLAECEELYGPDKEPLITRFPESVSIEPYEVKVDDNAKASGLEPESGAENLVEVGLSSSDGEKLLDHSSTNENSAKKEKISNSKTNKQSDSCNPIYRKVEAYIKEHIRPLCKSGVITVEEYRWAVTKTTDKVMKFHSKEKNANFLIKEGEKVKKLAEKYVETAQWTEKS